MGNYAQAMASKLKQGMVPIDAIDLNGRELHQYEALFCDGYCSVILWSEFNGDYVAFNEEGGWINREDMDNGERVLYTKEEDWEDVHYTISKLCETEAESVIRLMVSHYNMSALFEESVRSLKEIERVTQDEQTKAFAGSKLEHLKNLLGRQATETTE